MLSREILTTLPGVPVARLNIDGLVLCSFNHRTLVWELAFLRDMGHDLEIEVKELDSQMRVARDRTVKIGQGVRLIDLDIDGGSNAHTDIFLEGYLDLPPFTSRHGDHSPNFKWVLDFVNDVPHNFKGLKNGRSAEVPVTIVRVPYSLLYTNNVTEYSVVLSKHSTCNPDQGEAIGFANKDIGGLLFASEPGEIRMTDGSGNSVIEPLPAAPGYLYEIKITNMDNGTSVRPCPAVKAYVAGDLFRYYDVVDVEGDRYDLWAPPNKMHAKDGDCHGVVVTGFETLMSLVEG